MNKSRLLNFLDGVAGIILTILIISIKQPEDPTIQSVWRLKLNYIAYIISFLIIATKWINQQQQFQQIEKVDSRLMWWTLADLFFLSWVPYLTIYVSEFYYEIVPQMLYGINFIILHFFHFFYHWEFRRIDPENEAINDHFPHRQF